jgi:protein TonB
LAERLRTGAGRRTLGISLALLIEALLLLALLSLGSVEQPGDKEERITAVNIKAEEVAEEAPEPSEPEREQRAEERPAPQQPAIEEPLPPQPVEPRPEPPARIVLPVPDERLPPAAIPPATTPPAPPKRVYGPPDRRASSSRDTERVGTAPNGEPLYAAAWYREPRDEDLRAYLSTANGPGWGLIACRTAPNYRVEDCVALDEYPNGSQITRAILAAAWEFKVRPPQLGGRPLVGSWVRIRIDYGITRR